MNINCTFWLFTGCEELTFTPVYLALFVVVAFHKTTGMFESVRPEHRADYALGSHAIFHFEKQGMLATRLAQILWMLAACSVGFLQGYIGREFLKQCLIWISETIPWETPRDNERTPSRFSIYFNLTLLLGFTLLLVVFSVHWVIVFTGLCMWRPRNLSDEEAGIEMVTLPVEDNSLEVQNESGDIATASARSEGNHINRTSSPSRSIGALVEGDPGHSTNTPPPNREEYLADSMTRSA